MKKSIITLLLILIPSVALTTVHTLQTQVATIEIKGYQDDEENFRFIEEPVFPEYSLSMTFDVEDPYRYNFLKLDIYCSNPEGISLAGASLNVQTNLGSAVPVPLHNVGIESQIVFGKVLGPSVHHSIAMQIEYPTWNCVLNSLGNMASAGIEITAILSGVVTDVEVHQVSTLSTIRGGATGATVPTNNRFSTVEGKIELKRTAIVIFEPVKNGIFDVGIMSDDDINEAISVASKNNVLSLDDEPSINDQYGGPPDNPYVEVEELMAVDVWDPNQQKFVKTAILERGKHTYYSISYGDLIGSVDARRKVAPFMYGPSLRCDGSRQSPLDGPDFLSKGEILADSYHFFEEIVMGISVIASIERTISGYWQAAVYRQASYADEYAEIHRTKVSNVMMTGGHNLGVVDSNNTNTFKFSIWTADGIRIYSFDGSGDELVCEHGCGSGWADSGSGL